MTRRVPPVRAGRFMGDGKGEEREGERRSSITNPRWLEFTCASGEKIIETVTENDAPI